MTMAINWIIRFQFSGRRVENKNGFKVEKCCFLWYGGYTVQTKVLCIFLSTIYAAVKVEGATPKG